MEVLGNTVGDIILYQNYDENKLKNLTEKIVIDKDILIDKIDNIVSKDVRLYDKLLILPRYIGGIKICSISSLFIKEYSNVKELDVPYGITSIGTNALKDNKLEYLYLPTTYIEERNNSICNVDNIVFKGRISSSSISKEDMEYYYYRDVKRLIFEGQEVSLK